MSLIVAGQYAAAIGTILGLAGVLFRFLVLLPLKAYIKELTYPIQPNANGGKSLPDIADKLNKVEAKIDGIERRVMRLEDTRIK
jgi:hypothetical protein